MKTDRFEQVLTDTNTKGNVLFIWREKDSNRLFATMAWNKYERLSGRLKAVGYRIINNELETMNFAEVRKVV